MAFITREDGERFVIPAYRDVITAKTPSVLKKEVSILCNSYGDYITLQRKGPIQYEVAFSGESGYLLGESVWHHFKRPLDMIYCEALPNSTEAILVIVKSGSVYLDGSFPIDNISEELIIFLTQQNNFDIYVYGDVPISQTSEVGKFSFESSSVRSFTTLDKPAFPILELLRIYQLQLADTVLKSQGIGVFPAKKAVVGVAIVGLLWIMWTFMSTSSQTEVTKIIISQVNPYQGYLDMLSSPAPDQEITEVMQRIQVFYAMPGWTLTSLDYADGKLKATAKSNGSNIGTLNDWAGRNGLSLDILDKGITLALSITIPKRPMPTKIYPLKQTIINFTDKIALIYPGNHLSFGEFAKRSVFSDVLLTIALSELTPGMIVLIGNQCAGLPLLLKSMALTQDESGLFSGTMVFQVAGN